MQGISFFGRRDGNQSGGIRVDNGCIAEGTAERDSDLTKFFASKGLPSTFKLSVRIGLLTVIGPAWRYCITLTSFAACVAKAEKRSNGISLIF